MSDFFGHEYDEARNLRPWSEGNSEIGCTVYPTRRVLAIQSAPGQMWIWNMARVEWFNPYESGTYWEAINRNLIVRGRVA